LVDQSGLFMARKRGLITGITGQDGSYLAGHRSKNGGEKGDR